MKVALGIILFLLFAGSLVFLGFNVFKINRRKAKRKGGYDVAESADKKNFIFIIGSAVLALVFLITFIFIPFGFVEVQAGEIAVVKEWGEAKSTRSAGLHFKYP